MRARRRVPILESLERRADDLERHLLIESYRDLANEIRELLPLQTSPNPPAPRLTRHLAVLERALGHAPPADVLTGWDVLRVARRRSLL